MCVRVRASHVSRGFFNLGKPSDVAVTLPPLDPELLANDPVDCGFRQTIGQQAGNEAAPRVQLPRRPLGVGLALAGANDRVLAACIHSIVHSWGTFLRVHL